MDGGVRLWLDFLDHPVVWNVKLIESWGQSSYECMCLCAIHLNLRHNGKDVFIILTYCSSRIIIIVFPFNSTVVHAPPVLKSVCSQMNEQVTYSDAFRLADGHTKPD